MYLNHKSSSHDKVLPKISILVATWNCKDHLDTLLKSIAQQSCTDCEIIFLDNCSTDGTIQSILHFSANNPRISLILSSISDKGIYDAWNRGILLSQGLYLCFIGADDTFSSDDALQKLVELSDSSTDIITCRNAYYSRSGRFLRIWGNRWRWSRMRESMNIAHPGMLVKRSLFTLYGLYDTTFKICGDYEWFLRLSPHISSLHYDIPILNIVQAGVSHTRISTLYAETFRAQNRHLSVLWSSFCWVLNWSKYIRRRLIGLA